MTQSNAREEVVLNVALEAFSRYGFKRTSMDDLAKASRIPRTALYRLFRNKEHIFMALAERVHEQAFSEAVQKLGTAEPLAQRIENALIARDLHLLQIGHSGPHADEIAELYLELAGELSGRFNCQLEKLLAGAALAAIEDGSFTLPPAFRDEKDFALLLRVALEGVKKEVKSMTRYEQLARQLVRSIAVGAP